MSKFDLELFRQLWKACQAGTIPPVWIDDFVIRINTPGGMRRISDRQARELLKGKTVEQILQDVREKHDAYVFSRKLDWVYRQSNPNPRFPKDQQKVRSGRSNQEKQMKRGTPGHPKMIQLSDKLDIPLPYAVGIVEMLWHFTAQYAKHGNIGKYSNRVIANSLHWQGDHNLLIDSLVECGWLDQHAKHRLIVHDWSDHCEDSIHTQIARAHEYFADGQAPRIRHMNSDERRALMKIYEEASPDTLNPVEPEVPQANLEKTETVLEDVAPPQEECGDAAPTPVATLHLETRSLSRSHARAKPCLAMPEPSSSPPAKPHHRPKKPDDDEKTKIEVTRAQLVAWRYSPTKRGPRGQEYRPRPDDDVCRQVLRECGGSTDLLADFLREKSKAEPVVNGWGWFPQAIRNQLAGVIA